jgi:hypothetical protein
MMQPPPPLGTDWKAWGERLNSFLATTRDKLRYLTGGESASDDGVMMWDRETQHIVATRDGAFVPLSWGYNAFVAISDFTDQTVTTINTATAVTWDTIGGTSFITIGTPTSRIVFSRAGRYHVSFTAQITSTNSSSKTVWFFPRINGIDIEGSTMKTTIKDNNATKIQSRSGIFTVEADDYLEVMWATDDIAVRLDSAPATSFAPATPSVTLMINEINA